MNQIEPQWIAQAQNGNSEAFRRIVEACQTHVYNLCYRMLGEQDEAEDAAQETFLRAYLNMKQYDSERPFSTWLLSIAAHYCIDQIRKRRLSFLSFDEMPYLDPPEPSPGPEMALRLGEEQQRVQHLLGTLNPQDRAAVVMLYWYDLSYEEIAATLKMTVSAVKSRLHRARAFLAQGWQEQETKFMQVERRRNDHAKSPAF